VTRDTLLKIAFISVADLALDAHGNISALSLGWNWCWTPTPWHDVVVRLLVTPSRFHSGDFSGELQLEDADGHSVPLTADYP